MTSWLYTALIPISAAGAGVGLLAWHRPQDARLAKTATLWLGASFVLALAAWLGRWYAAGHWPIFGTYESALSLALAVLFAAVLAASLPRLRGAGPTVAALAGAVAAAVLLHGRAYDATIYALTISERSWVVDVHALVAWAAFGCLSTNAALAIAVVFGRGGRALEEGLEHTLLLGFVLHTAMLASGSFYEFLLFGRAWSFDPIETLGLASWLAYGTLLHLQRMAGWDGRRLAAWCLVLFVVLVVSYRAIVFFPASSTYHIFDIDLRLHT